MKKIIAVDIDDTICETAKTVMEMLHQTFGSPQNQTIPDILRMYRQPGDVTFWQTKEAVSFITQLLQSEEFLYSIKPISHAQSVLNTAVNNGYEIWFMTSRSTSLFDVTQRWLDANTFSYRTLICRKEDETKHNWKLALLHARAKEEMITFIDDTIEAFKPVTPEFNYTGILFNRWQKITLPQNIIVCTNWLDINTYLK